VLLYEHAIFYSHLFSVRNTYILINWGNFVGGNTSNRGKAYIQLLSITDPSKSHIDWMKNLQSRLNGGQIAASNVEVGLGKKAVAVIALLAIAGVILIVGSYVFFRFLRKGSSKRRLGIF